MNRKEILYYVYIFSIVSATTFLSLHILETRSISGQIIEDDILDLGEINNNIDLGDKLTRRIEKKEKMTDFVVDREKNSYGFHDEEWKKQKDNDTYRIAAIGDSFTEGSYVKGNNTWPSRLEGILNKRQNSTNFEVLNMAKGGNFIYEKYSIFQNYTLDFNPDMVILQYYHNDWRKKKRYKSPSEI